uniref:Condensin complex subunit 2 n=1 Tax=Strigamia maritima TaxID=126957 RepID=T1IIW2_STRMM
MKSNKSKSNHVPLSPHALRNSNKEATTPFCEFQNDDTGEKRDRQKVLELHQNMLQTPRVAVEKRLSMGNVISGLSNAQMTEHYSNCIKLSSENKITMKNAFNLHLIDYMQNMMKKKDSDMENFQMASCTLDASAKIYASRVDFVYTEAFKVAGGLNRKNEKTKKPQSDEEGKGGEENCPTPVKKRKVRTMLRTIEKNLENLNLNKLDDEYSLDPLHQKLRHAFDEGGTGGLLLNTLSIADDSCQLQFDSRIPAFGARDDKPIRDDVFDLSNMSQAIGKLLNPDIKICPYFANFSFLNSSLNENQFLNSSLQENFAFDPEKCTENAVNNLESSSDGVAADCDDFEIEPQMMGDGEINSDNHNVENIRTDKQIDLHTALSIQPSEYSYFNVDFLRSWAGPDRWHTAPLSKTTATRIQTKQTKEPFFVKFDKQIDWSEELKLSKQSKELSKRTLEAVWTRTKNILPVDLHYKPEVLTRLFLKPQLSVSRKKPSVQVDDAVNHYDYENANDDCENFCPAQNSAHDQSADLFSFEELSATVCNNNGLGDGTLLQQPYKVNKIDIPYARTAKRINIKKVKSGLLKIIQLDNIRASDAPRNALKFSSLYKKLPTCISGKTLENMSVPIAFVCLLYLANEEKLDITNGENLKDLFIKQ